MGGVVSLRRCASLRGAALGPTLLPRLGAERLQPVDYTCLLMACRELNRTVVPAKFENALQPVGRFLLLPVHQRRPLPSRVRVGCRLSNLGRQPLVPPAAD